MYVAMGLAAAVCVVTGVFPGGTLYAVLPFDAVYQPFTAHHFVEALQILIGTALGFWLLRVKLGGEPTMTSDVDVLYLRPLSWVVNVGGAALEGLGRQVGRLTSGAVDGTWTGLQGSVSRVGTPAFSVQSAITVSAIAGGAWFFIWLLQ
jgi:multicomponent Na+:H+ antiporter subunit D